MSINNKKPSIFITNEKTMKKIILSKGCLECGKVDGEENANDFNFYNAVACPNCGTIYIPNNNLRLINKVLISGDSFSYYTTDGVMQDDLGTVKSYNPGKPKCRILTPMDDAAKSHSVK